jgi:hypothetical protein
VDEKNRSMIMLLLVGGPIITLLFALAPDTRQPLNTQSPTNSSRDGAEAGQPPPFSLDGIDKGDTVAEPNNSREKHAEELVLRATLAQERQARWAQWQGVAGIIGLFAALAILLYTHFTLSATATAATAAIKSAEAAEAHLHAVDRPWVTARVRPAGPLAVLANGDIEFPVQTLMTNVGPSVAQHVDFQLFMTPSVFEDGNDWHIRNQVWNRLTHFLARHKPHMGMTLFPNEKIGQNITLLVSAGEMMEAWKRHPELIAIPQNERPIPLLIVGRITYSQNGVKALRSTDFGYQVTKLVGKSKVNPLVGTTPPEEIEFTISSIGLNHAT